MSNNTISIIYTTLPNQESADTIATKLLEQKLIICTNSNKINSKYLWQGKIENSQEIKLLIKTTKKMKKNAIKALKSLHPYDIPAILSWEANSKEKYQDWINEEI